MRLTVTDLAFSYPGTDKAILDRVNFELNSGQTLAITAPSGRGKSTLLHLVGGLLQPTRGRIEINGVPVPSPPLTSKPYASWILQNNGLLPRRTALDNVMVTLLARGEDNDTARERSMHALKLLGVDDVAHSPTATLSGGQYQRVGVARGLVWPAAIVLADEPTANLDAANAKTVADALYSRLTNAPVIVVTHDPAVAAGADAVLDLS